MSSCQLIAGVFCFFPVNRQPFSSSAGVVANDRSEGAIDFRKKVRIRKETDTSTTAGGKKRVVRPRKLDQPACRREASGTQDLGVTSLHPVGRHHLDRKVAGDYQ